MAGFEVTTEGKRGSDVTYEPYVLSLLTLLTDACSHVDQALHAEIKTKVSQKRLLSPEFTGTQGATWHVSKLRAASRGVGVGPKPRVDSVL